MKQLKSQQSNKVVPFTGEFYPQVPDTPVSSPISAYITIVAAALIGGLAIGAIATYQSADQVQLRELKAQSERLQAVQNQVCNQP